MCRMEPSEPPSEPGLEHPAAARRLDRRQLLVRGGLLAGATGIGGAAGYALGRDEDGREAGAATAAPVEDEREFALDPGLTNLTTFVLAAHPRRVRLAIERHRAALDENPSSALLEGEPGLEEEGRTAAASYLGAEVDDVALTDSTTMGLGLVYGGLRLGPGDEIVTTEHDFYATHEALRLRAERDGVSVRRIRLHDHPATADSGRIADAVAESLTRETRALAVTWVHSSTGVKLPLADLADVVAAANRGRPDAERILLCVDGVHGFGVEAASPVELGADVFVSGCHKWLFGPRGTGIVWAAPHAWERIAPTLPSFDGQAYLAWLEGRAPTGAAPARLATPGGYHSFEHRWALAEAFAFHDALGRDEVERHTHGLAARLKDGLSGVTGVLLVTPADQALSSGLVCCDVPGTAVGEVVERLRVEHGVVASGAPYATPYLRFGPSIANDEADVDRAVEAMAAITA